jgi:hypothetical protein
VTPALLAVAVAAAVSYWAGRTRLGHRLLEWAEDRSYGRRTPGWWVAQVVGLVAVAWMVTAHPRRSAANRRSWREARDVKRAPAPQFRSDWLAERRTTPPPKEQP